jgi:hypothetical protein
MKSDENLTKHPLFSGDRISPLLRGGESSWFSNLPTFPLVPLQPNPIGNGNGNKMVFAERTHLLDSSSNATDTCSSTSTTIRLCNVHDTSPHSHKKRKQQASGKSWLQQAVMSLDPDGIRFAARMSIILSLCTLFVLIQVNHKNFPMGFWVSAIANNISHSVETH